MVKVLLDTDIGSDIDDAVCLAYLLANPECELMGITTVSGEPVKRASMASALCMEAGKSVPIYPGAEKPFLTPLWQTEATQASALEKWKHESNFPEGQAVSFLRETIRENPGEIVLLTIGPLTNAGLLFTLDPEIPSLLGGFYMMCGIFTNRLPGVGPLEWNALCDPYATAMAYRHPVKVHRSVGLDVTCQVSMKAGDVKDRFTHPLLKPVRDFADVWFQHTDQIIFHDPLAAAAIFDERICKFTPGTVEVELASKKLRGVTHFKAEGEDHEVALEVDPQRFFDHFFGVLN